MRTFALKWVFPGGHVNAGETFEQAGKWSTLNPHMINMHLRNTRGRGRNRIESNRSEIVRDVGVMVRAQRISTL